MAGLYIHIPLCTQRCSYCDFFSTTLLNKRVELIDALCKEMKMRADYLPVDANVLETIYIGGGTPSLLSSAEINILIDCALDSFPHVDTGKMEITMEANPNDLTEGYLKELSDTAINRLSIGCQSFNDTTLKVINRRHNAEEAKNAIANARKYGFNNISIDLIYGLPSQTIDSWKDDVATAIALKPNHISAYCLELHEGSLLTKKISKGELTEMDEADCLICFKHLREATSASGYEHYEISNFAQKGFRSRHNSSYWHDIPYIGIGPAAHSYNGVSRQWNVSHLPKYLKAISENRLETEIETLSVTEKYNDYILTALRTSDGIDFQYISNKFETRFSDLAKEVAAKQQKDGNVEIIGEKCHLTEKGIFISDSIFTEFIVVDEE
ncbi:MAG: radical SAM family heme chaperone HemW [Paludibacteraceae bacterium]|nr:radical SAM family heme chaperone HemW [Paludibacteraceae bacterium]